MTAPTPLERLTDLYVLGGHGRQSAQLAANLLAEHDAGKDTRDADQAPAGASTLGSNVLDLLAAIRDALDVPTPELGTPGGYEAMRLLTTRRAAAVHLAAEVAVQMGTPHWGVLAEGIRHSIDRHPVTYPVWKDDEPACSCTAGRVQQTTASGHVISLPCPTCTPAGGEQG